MNLFLTDGNRKFDQVTEFVAHANKPIRQELRKDGVKTFNEYLHDTTGFKVKPYPETRFEFVSLMNGQVLRAKSVFLELSNTQHPHHNLVANVQIDFAYVEAVDEAMKVINPAFSLFQQTKGNTVFWGFRAHYV